MAVGFIVGVSCLSFDDKRLQSSSHNIFPAQIIMMFLKIYCPSSVKLYGRCWKIARGKSKYGLKVNPMWMNKNIKAGLSKIRLSNMIPNKHSQVASSLIETSSETIPKVKQWRVARAIWSAGLSPGKNLRNPNHKYTSPMLQRNMFIAVKWLLFLALMIIIKIFWMVTSCSNVTGKFIWLQARIPKNNDK